MQRNSTNNVLLQPQDHLPWLLVSTRVHDTTYLAHGQRQYTRQSLPITVVLMTPTCGSHRSQTTTIQMTPTCANDTNLWQSRTTTIPMTPTCGSHEQLQYRGHQHVADPNNYNTEDTNMWQSQTTTIQRTPTCGSHRQHIIERLRNQWSKLCTIFTTWTNCSSRCTEP